MRVTRELKLCAGCCWFASCCDCCSYELKIESPGIIFFLLILIYSILKSEKNQFTFSKNKYLAGNIIGCVKQRFANFNENIYLNEFYF